MPRDNKNDPLLMPRDNKNAQLLRPRDNKNAPLLRRRDNENASLVKPRDNKNALLLRPLDNKTELLLWPVFVVLVNGASLYIASIKHYWPLLKSVFEQQRQEYKNNLTFSSNQTKWIVMKVGMIDS